jgi:uncharacterized membrane protein YdjX (TVP38/TMEM64 family)
VAVSCVERVPPEDRRSVDLRARCACVVATALLVAGCTAIPANAESAELVSQLKQNGQWAWAVGILLIWADIILPMPQTVVVAALGMIYGPVMGGLIGTVGLISGAWLGYALTFTSARRLMLRVAGGKSLNRMEKLFDRAGVWAIILSRSLPFSIPEVLVIVAGLAGMPWRKFLFAVIIGCTPTGLVFAAIGAGWSEQPIVALSISYMLPVILLPMAMALIEKLTKKQI